MSVSGTRVEVQSWDGRPVAFRCLKRTPSPVSSPVLSPGTNPSYALVGTDVAIATGTNEPWNIGNAKGKGVDACFAAVLAEPRCAEYFTYMTGDGDGNCGCKGGYAAGLSVRSDPSSSYYVISGRNYVFGDLNSSKCPANYVPIVDQATCSSAAMDTGKLWGGNVTNAARPMGCFWYNTSTATSTTKQVFLNLHATGAGESNTRPLCASAPPSPLLLLA
jgi:hypothetical protein